MRRESLLALALFTLGQAPLLAQGEATTHPFAPPISAAGCSGLVRIPTADVRRYGTYTLGANVVDGDHRPIAGQNTVVQFVTIGVIPRVEVTARATNFEGRLGAQFRDTLPGKPMGGWNFDRSAGLHVQILRPSTRWPVALAAGSHDVTGNGPLRARYLVASRRWPKVGAHLGIGDGTLGTLFGGVDYRASEQVRVLLDHDGKRANLGCAVEFHRFVISPYLTGLKSLGGGITYNQPL